VIEKHMKEIAKGMQAKYLNLEYELSEKLYDACASSIPV
jgi:hypothetical protein